MRYAAQLSKFYNQWCLITTDRTLLSWINGYKLSFSKPVVQNTPPTIVKHSDTEKAHFNKAIQQLLTIGAISECEPCEGQFLSSIFIRPKPNGKMRLILNLKSLNKFIDTSHFKLEDFRTAIKLVSKDNYMANIDLKDAYHLIKIHEHSRKYLRFIWDGLTYEFNVLPFGLNTAPYIFTKVMKPVVKLLRTCGYLSTIYLDDIYLIGQSYRDCKENLYITQKLLKSLGLLINVEKSNLTPSKSCKFLGLIIDSKNLQVKLPIDKRTHIQHELTKMMNRANCTIRKFAQLVGLLISACPAIEYGMLYTKEFERLKFLNLKDHDDYNRLMYLPKSLQPDFKWWLHAIKNSVRIIRTDDYSAEIFTDASTTGWGAACENQTASGMWSPNERAKHINYLELLAAFLGLKTFARDLHHCQILMRIDNATAIAYINRMGGVQFPHLTKITKDIWQWCEARHIFIYASYIKSSENSIADAESRRLHPDTEWQLQDTAFQIIAQKYGHPQIDLFATRINTKCKNYVSWHRDPDALAINAFTISWSNMYFYAFPPFAIILKTLKKIISDKGRGIVVVPQWPTQPWYPIFLKLLVSDVTIFKPNESVIPSNYSNPKIHGNLTLVAGVLCGQHYCVAESHHQQLTS